MNATVIEGALVLFWLAYLGLHLWLFLADPVDQEPMILEVKE